MPGGPGLVVWCWKPALNNPKRCRCTEAAATPRPNRSGSTQIRRRAGSTVRICSTTSPIPPRPAGRGTTESPSERRDVLLGVSGGSIGFRFDDGSDRFGCDGVGVAEWAGPVESSGAVWVLGDGPVGEGVEQVADLAQAAEVVVRGGAAVGVGDGVIDLAGLRGS